MFTTSLPRVARPVDSPPPMTELSPTFDEVRSRLEGIPHMSPRQGRIVYDHVRETRPQLILELGTANGVSAGYMAAALRANGSGRIVSVDIDEAHYEPGPRRTLESVGLSDLVELVRVPDSSYNWMLRRQIAERSDAAGNCAPLYDLIFLDGAHEFTIDGLATVLAGKLLKPDGWFLLDDLNWALADNPWPVRLSADERERPHMLEVFELILKQDPDYDRFRIEDGAWGWAHKGTGPRRMEITVTHRPLDVARGKLLDLTRQALNARAQRSGR